jgi:hypothetical protein
MSSGLENKLRAALRDTAGEIPATPPPLRLPPERDSARSGPARPGPVWPAQRRWISWAAPLAAAVLVLAVVAASLAVVRGGSGRTTSEPPGLAAVPPYYVALTAPAYPDVYDGNATVAEVRATATSAVLARVVPPKPYVHFAGVTAAADDRTFVLVAEAKSNPPSQGPKPGQLPRPYYQPSRFYLMRFDPGTGRVSLRGLPLTFIPANAEVHDMALSPDGTALAADIGRELSGSHLVVFNLVTGNERAWSFKACAQCNPSGGGLGYGGTNVDALSWTGDGKHVAFVGPNRAGWPSHSTVRLLDVTLPGSDLLANSRPVAPLPPGDNATDLSWRGVIITPDGRTVVIVEELATNRAPIMVRDRLLKVSVATGRVTVLNDRNVLAGYQYEQVMYSNASGSVLVVSGVRKGMTAGVVRGNRYTPIRWSRKIATAAW